MTPRLSSQKAPNRASKTFTCCRISTNIWVGYRDRSAVLDEQYTRRTNNGGGILKPVILYQGQVVVTWKRTLKKDAVNVVPAWFSEQTPAQTYGFGTAAHRYRAYLGLPLMIAPTIAARQAGRSIFPFSHSLYNCP